jgi:large subunit ribosomal protein L17
VRHKVYGRHLGRNIDERKALFKNLVSSLILSETIQTTEAKAKAIKGLVDKLISSSKSPTTKRLVSQFIVNKQVSEKLFNEIVPRLGERNSGFTSITRLGRRAGDGATIVQMKLLLESVEGKGKSVKSESEAKEPASAKASAGKGGNLLSRARAGVSRSKEAKSEPKKAAKKETKK